RYDDDIDRLFFYSLSSAKVHSIQLPVIDGEKISGSFDGWLVLENKLSCTISILNPLTGVHIHLPMLPRYLWNNKNCPSLWRMATSSNSSTSYKGCIIVVIPTQFNFLLAINEDHKWTKLDNMSDYTDVIYFKESFYVIDRFARVSIFDSCLRKVTVNSTRGNLRYGACQLAKLSEELIVFKTKYVKNSAN
ncbi:unnamed protein product, partial [Musa acuminata var. zebrina]